MHYSVHANRSVISALNPRVLFLFLVEGIDNDIVNASRKFKLPVLSKPWALMFESFPRKSIFIGEQANVLHIHVALVPCVCFVS